MTGRAVGVVDGVALDMVASHLDLRVPNKRAVKTIALRVGEHEASGADGVFEGVIDAAVGMGKTYIVAAAMDYVAAAEGIWTEVLATLNQQIEEARWTLAEIEETTWGVTFLEIESEAGS